MDIDNGYKNALCNMILHLPPKNIAPHIYTLPTLDPAKKIETKKTLSPITQIT